MKNTILIRPENQNDIEAIHQITYAAFDPMPFSNNTEARIIDDLRAAGDLALSLVAVKEDDVVGQVSFSKVTLMAWMMHGMVLALWWYHQKCN